jgi:hypothetical protein
LNRDLHDVFKDQSKALQLTSLQEETVHIVPDKIKPFSHLASSI